MKFEVLRSSDNSMVMQTTSRECIDVNEIDVLASAGYKFRVDGKIVSKQTAKMYASAEPTEAVVLKEESTEDKVRIVRCVTTGETFKNQSLAAKAYSIDPAQVSDSIKTGRPRSGYVFEYCYVDKEE